MNPPENTDANDLPVFEPDFEATYTLDVVAHLTGVSTETVLRYHERGLLPARADVPAGERRFDDEALRAVRRLEHLRSEWQLQGPALDLTLGLLAEIERLQKEARVRK